MIKYLPFLLLLSACSSGVVIHDGEQDVLVGEERVESGCNVYVDSDYTDNTTHESETRKVTVNSKE